MPLICGPNLVASYEKSMGGSSDGRFSGGRCSKLRISIVVPAMLEGPVALKCPGFAGTCCVEGNSDLKARKVSRPFRKFPKMQLRVTAETGRLRQPKLQSRVTRNPWANRRKEGGREMGGGVRLSRDGTTGPIGTAIGAGTGNQDEMPSCLTHPKKVSFPQTAPASETDIHE